MCIVWTWGGKAWVRDPYSKTLKDMFKANDKQKQAGLGEKADSPR